MANTIDATKYQVDFTEETEAAKKDKILASAKEKMQDCNISAYNAAIKDFESILGWKDANDQLEICKKKIKELEVKAEIESRVVCIAIARERNRPIAFLYIIIVGVAFLLNGVIGIITDIALQFTSVSQTISNAIFTFFIMVLFWGITAGISFLYIFLSTRSSRKGFVITLGIIVRTILFLVVLFYGITLWRAFLYYNSGMGNYMNDIDLIALLITGFIVNVISFVILFFVKRVKT